MKKKLLSLSVVALFASMMFGTVANASDKEDMATGTDAVIEEVADEDTTEIEVAETADEVVEDVEENEIDANKGWVQKGTSWYYYNDKGVKVTGWQAIGTSWYYFNASGVMQTGWLKDGGYWYYLTSGGKMQTGWAKIGADWYHFAASGKMHTGWVVVSGAWYYFGNSGVMRTGWQQIDGAWYYFDDGAMVSNTLARIGGKYYKFNKSGKMYTGWYSENIAGYDCWFYFGKDGLVKGWKVIGNDWYYFDPDTGIMVTGSLEIDGILYFFKDSGKYEGRNSKDNVYYYHWSRNAGDYAYGVDIKTLDIYYNGSNNIVLDALIINNTGRKIVSLKDINVSVNYEDRYDSIAKKNFGARDCAMSSYSTKEMSFTFDKSKIVDLRGGLDSVSYTFTYTYTY